MIGLAEYQQDVSQGTYEDRQNQAGLNEDEDAPKKILREEKLQVKHGGVALPFSLTGLPLSEGKRTIWEKASCIGRP